MENKTEYTMIKELIAKENRKQVVKVILGGAAGIIPALVAWGIIVIGGIFIAMRVGS